MNKIVTKVLSSSIVALPISLPLLSARCQNQNNSSLISSSNTHDSDARHKFVTQASLSSQILNMFPSMFGGLILNNIEKEKKAKEAKEKSEKEKSESSAFESESKDGFDFIIENQKDLFASGVPSFANGMEQIFLSLNPEYTSRYEAKIVGAGFNDLEGTLTLVVQILHKPESNIENNEGNKYFQKLEFTGFKKFDASDSNKNVINLHYGKENLLKSYERGTSLYEYIARKVLRNYVNDSPTPVEINGNGWTVLKRLLALPNASKQISVNANDYLEIYKTNNQKLTLSDIISHKHGAIVYPFFGLFEDYRNIYSDPTDDNLKVYLYKNADKKDMLKVKIILTVNAGIQDIYTNIDRDTSGKPKITFTLEAEAPYDDLIPDISEKVENVIPHWRRSWLT
ncbi:Hypothetical protein, predicted lipoprotein [Mycoplasmopsis agalactiae 14628]|uniref:Lipoprotein n=1 Tax=Mycoplasmopsis agalactiae 14628 TaxID=1110504 RepID=I5D534_MYCAA|nr:hypothetical protein [Mycoplasmopsis agalactiae]EIN14793.1 Hypothetical protein, predicted lipoprotein [Mycoplasmopsis agalactiae 14628]